MDHLKSFLLLLIVILPFNGRPSSEDMLREHPRNPLRSFPVSTDSEKKEEKKKVYENLKSKAIELGLSTEGGIGALKARIREFESRGTGTHEIHIPEEVEILETAVGHLSLITSVAPPPAPYFMERERGSFRGRGGGAGRGSFRGATDKLPQSYARTKAEKQDQYFEQLKRDAVRLGVDYDSDDDIGTLKSKIHDEKEKRSRARTEKQERYLEQLKGEAESLGVSTWGDIDDIKKRIHDKKEEDYLRQLKARAESLGVSTWGDIDDIKGRISDKISEEKKERPAPVSVGRVSKSVQAQYDKRREYHEMQHEAFLKRELERQRRGRK